MAGLLVAGENLHDLEGCCTLPAEPLEDIILEDHPPEIGALNSLLVFTACSIVVIEGIPAEGTVPTHKFVQEYLFMAAWTGGVGGMHSGSHD